MLSDGVSGAMAVYSAGVRVHAVVRCRTSALTHSLVGNKRRSLCDAHLVATARAEAWQRQSHLAIKGELGRDDTEGGCAGAGALAFVLAADHLINDRIGSVGNALRQRAVRHGDLIAALVGVLPKVALLRSDFAGQRKILLRY